MKWIFAKLTAAFLEVAGEYVIQVGWRMQVCAYRLEPDKSEKDILGLYIVALHRALERKLELMRSSERNAGKGADRP